MVTELPPSVTFRFFDGQDRDLLYVGSSPEVKSWLATNETGESLVLLHLKAAYDLVVGALYDVNGVEQTLVTHDFYRGKAAEILHFDFVTSQNECMLSLAKIGAATQEAGAEAGFDLFIVFLGESGFFT